MITLYDINQILVMFKHRYPEFDFDLSDLWNWYEFTNPLRLNLLQKTAITWVNCCEQVPELSNILYLYAQMALNMRR